jgi:diguanylate cyclase (GGDEF)-like protein
MIRSEAGPPAYCLRAQAAARTPALTHLLRLALLWLLAMVCGAAWAHPVSHADASPPVLLDARSGAISLVGRIGYFEDVDQSLDISKVRDPSQQSRFIYPNDPLQGTESQRVLWFKVRVQAASPADVNQDRLLVVPTVSTNDLRFYGPFSDDDRIGAGESLEPHVTGMRHPYSTRALADEKMGFEFRLPDTRPHTIYLRVDSIFARIYAMSVWKPTDYLVSTQDKRLFDGVCYGVLLAMLVLAPPLLIVFRERIYAYYLLSVLFALLSVANFNGHALRYLFPDTPWLAGLSYGIAPGLWAICKLMFARRLLDLSHYAPFVDKLVVAMVVLLCATTLGGALGVMPWLLQVVQVTIILATVAMFSAAVAALRKGYWPAVFFIVSVGLLLAGISLMVVASWGLLAWTPAQMDVTQASLAAELVVFAAALGARLRLLSRSTQSLQRRAAKLQEALGTDPLTGAANRTGFEQRAGAALAAGTPVAVMLLDLDGFKLVNDTHGHAAGDAVLVEVGARLKQQVRATDLVARLGGDEFLLLVEGQAHREDLRALAARVVDAVRQPIAVPGHTVTVSVSLGIATSPSDGMALTGLMREADAAMYHCKKRHGATFMFAADMHPAAPVPAPLSSPKFASA